MKNSILSFILKSHPLINLTLKLFPLRNIMKNLNKNIVKTQTHTHTYIKCKLMVTIFMKVVLLTCITN